MKTEWSKEFSRRLRNCMAEQNITQGELSAATGIAQSNICRYMHGDQVPRIDNAVLIADTLNIDIAELANFKEEE